MIAQPLLTSSNPKHLLQALDLCMDKWSDTVMWIPSLLPRTDLWMVLELQSSAEPWTALIFALVGLVPCSLGRWLLRQNSLGVQWEFSELAPAWRWSALPPGWAEANTWENSSSHSSAGSFTNRQWRTAELAAWKLLLPTGCQLRRSMRNPAIPFFHTAIAISLFF